MSKFPKEEISEFYGFSVYDAETGGLASAADITENNILCGYFALDENGSLIAVMADSWHDTEVITVPKEGRYVIQFETGEYMRW